jgi:hypothetical protein
MANPWSRKAKVKKITSLKGLAKTNGKAPVKPSLASLSKGKPQTTPKPKLSLRKLVTTEPVVMERPYQEPKPRVKEDFRIGGVLFSGAEILGEITAGHRDGTFRPFGSVDVTNGDQTYTLHNRHGSWMHDVWGTNQMAEPARVAMWLGLHNMGQMQMAQALGRRFELELKKQGVPTTHQQRLKLEEQAAAARKRAAKHAAKPTIPKETTKVTQGKITLKGLKK